MEVDIAGQPDSNSPDQILDKYRSAGDVANHALYAVIERCRPGELLVDLCSFGDNCITELCGQRYPNLSSNQKGVAFPCCISVNEIAGHYSPYSSDQTVFQHGDLVKVDLGVHFDGYVAVVAHTIVIGQTFGRKADAIAASWTGLQSAIRLLIPGKTNSQVTLAIDKSASIFACEPVGSVLSHEMRQFVMDHENCILSKETPDRKVDEFEFEDFQVFGIDVVMSTGKGKVVDREDMCTIFKRNVDVVRPLKLQASRTLLHQINKQYPTFPFTMRNFEESRLKFGIRECKNYDLVQGYPVLSEKKGEFIAQFKATVIVLDSGAVQISGLPLDMSSIVTQFRIEDAELNELLATAPPQPPSYFDLPNPPQVALSIPEPATSSQQDPKKRAWQPPKKNNKKKGKQKKRSGQQSVKQRRGNNNNKRPGGRGRNSKRSGGQSAMEIDE